VISNRDEIVGIEGSNGLDADQLEAKCPWVACDRVQGRQRNQTQIATDRSSQLTTDALPFGFRALDLRVRHRSPTVLNTAADQTQTCGRLAGINPSVAQRQGEDGRKTHRTVGVFGKSFRTTECTYPADDRQQTTSRSLVTLVTSSGTSQMP
jgi:hypothetical protein